MRPSIAGWFDSTIRIRRPTPTLDVLKVESLEYTVIDTVGAKINRSKTPVVPTSGGEAPNGTIRWYGLVSIDVQPRDICEVLTGPDAGRTWEVNELPVRPSNHHTQVDCVEWHGELPDVEELS
jgi:hypothetical protein